MSPAAASPGGVPARSQIEDWDITHLEDAAARWQTSATEAEELFEQQRHNVASPGGTEWEGDAKDAALDRVTRDLAVVRAAGDTVRGAADLATNAAEDLRSAQRAALQAITEAEADGFKVGEDLSVTETRRVDVFAMAARHTAKVTHAENIQWNAQQLLATDSLIAERLRANATELDGIQFDGAGDSTIQAASFGSGGFKQDGDHDSWEPPVIKTEPRTESPTTVIDASPPEMFPNCDNTKVWLKIGQGVGGGLSILGGALGAPFTFGGSVTMIFGGAVALGDAAYEIGKCG